MRSYTQGYPRVPNKRAGMYFFSKFIKRAGWGKKSEKIISEHALLLYFYLLHKTHEITKQVGFNKPEGKNFFSFNKRVNRLKK